MSGKHMFAGVNGPNGFYSRFDQITEEVPNGRKIYIKGAPGTGKSTIMKRIAKKADALNLDYEVFHCSSDPSSYDAVFIPAYKTAILDATSPHNADPMYPMAGGEILDVARFLRRKELSVKADKLRFYADKKKRAFQKGYHYLRAALPLLEDMEAEYKGSMDFDALSDIADKMITNILGMSQCINTGKPRSFFASAITPEGFVNYLDTIFKDAHVITIKGLCGSDVILNSIKETALKRGYAPLLFYCPMHPQTKLEHIYIPELKKAVTSYNFYTHYVGAETVDLDAYIYQKADTGDSRSYAGALMQLAIDAFADAKDAHGFLENIYVPCMDFDALNEMTEELINSIF